MGDDELVRFSLAGGIARVRMNRPDRLNALNTEMRTELAIGETVSELTRNLSTGATQMLVLGITDVTHAATAYRSLLAAQPGWPVLIVYRPTETRAAPEIAA